MTETIVSFLFNGQQCDKELNSLTTKKYRCNNKKLKESPLKKYRMGLTCDLRHSRQRWEELPSIPDYLSHPLSNINN